MSAQYTANLIPMTTKLREFLVKGAWSLKRQELMTWEFSNGRFINGRRKPEIFQKRVFFYENP